MSVEAAQAREDKHGCIGRENVDGVPLSRTETADLMDSTMSLAEERTTKKRPNHCIGRGISEAATVY